MDFSGFMQPGSSANLMMWGLAAVSVIVLVILRRRAGGGKGKGGGSRLADLIPMIVFRRGNKIVITQATEEFGTATHPKYMGCQILPDSVSPMRSGGVWGRLPKAPSPVSDEASKEEIREALVQGTMRDLAEARLRKSTRTLAIRELDASPVTLEKGRKVGFYPGAASMTLVQAASTAAQLRAEAEHIRYGAIGNETVKMFGWAAAIGAIAAILSWGCVVGFRMWVSFHAIQTGS